MITPNLYDILDYAIIVTEGLMNFLVFILLIVVAVNNMKKELGIDCKKGFSRFFVAVLIFLMFSTFMDFAYSLTFKIMYELLNTGELDPWSFINTINIVWGITYGLGFLNKLLSFILLFSSMEINLFNKKSKWKFGILAIILIGGIFLMEITFLVLNYTIDYSGIVIMRFVLDVLSGFNYLILAIVILILLGKTAKEDESLKKYTGSISIGVVFLFIIYPLMKSTDTIAYFIGYLVNYPNEIYYWISLSVFFLASISFIIGIIFLSIAAVKTMNVPLTFSRQKGAKGAKGTKEIPRKDTNSCSECGAAIPPLAEFCTNCGHHT